MPTIKKILGVLTTTAAPPPRSSELLFSCDKIVTKLFSNWPDPGLKNHKIEIEITKNNIKKLQKKTTKDYEKKYQPFTKKKSRIRETKHLSTDADSSTDAIGGWTKAISATKKNFFLARGF